jgi:hypothetical protein
MQNVDLTYAQDLGAVTELLSVAFFQPLGRSSSHQTWSSAMALTPAIRGLFGLDWDALHHTLRLAPHLPASWNSARLHRVPLGNSRIDLDFQREGDHLLIQARSDPPAVVCLVPQTAAREDCRAPRHELRIELPPAEIGIPHGLPQPGSTTQQLKVLAEERFSNRLTITMEAPGGSTYELPLRINRPGLHVSGAEIADEKLRVRFPTGPGYQREVVRLSW